MHILMVVNHGCVRVVKESIALKKRGHTVDLVCGELMFAANRFDTFSLFHDAAQLHRTVRASHAQIIHVHNEPDWLVDVCKDAAGSRPVVFDVHDLESLRWQRDPDADERRAFASADGFVHVSDICQVIAHANHPKHSDKPTAILPCYINGEFYAPDFRNALSPAWNTVVYEGGLALSTDVPPGSPPGTGNFRGLEPLVTAFTAADYNVHLYPSRALDHSVYEDRGAVVQGTLHFPILLRALRTYGYGLVGGPVETPLMHAALPNKLFEYISQGVVPVVYKADRAARWVEETGMGIVLRDLDDITDQLGRGPFARIGINKGRWHFTMERNIVAIESLYSQLGVVDPIVALASVGAGGGA